MLEGGAAVDIADRHGNQPLWAAVFNARGDYAIVRRLIECGADPAHANVHGRSPRDFAEQIGDDTLLRVLDKDA